MKEGNLEFQAGNGEREVKMEREMIVVLDFGGQYNQLIARRVRECNVYCEVHPCTLSLEQLKAMNPKGIIFTGGPTVFTQRILLCVMKKCTSWEFLFWESAMAPR